MEPEQLVCQTNWPAIRKDARERGDFEKATAAVLMGAQVFAQNEKAEDVPFDVCAALRGIKRAVKWDCYADVG